MFLLLIPNLPETYILPAKNVAISVPVQAGTTIVAAASLIFNPNKSHLTFNTHYFNLGICERYFPARVWKYTVCIRTENMLKEEINITCSRLRECGADVEKKIARELGSSRPFCARVYFTILPAGGGEGEGVLEYVLGGCVPPRPPNVNRVLERVCSRGDTPL